MRLNCSTRCDSIAAFFLLIAFSASSVFTSPVYVSSADNQPPPPHQLHYTRPLPYHRLVEHESKPPPDSSASHVEAIPHPIESRIHSSPGAYHSPPDAPVHYLPAAPQQTRLHLLPPQPLPSSLYPRHAGEPGEYQSEYSNPIRLEEAENHPSQESHPLEPVFENSHVPGLVHDSGPHGNYHPRLKYDHAPGSHQHRQQFSDDLQPHPSSHVPGVDVPAKTELYHSQDTYGNYGFGYQTQTIKGDGDYRYEKREGSETSGGYGFKTDGGKVEAHFHTHPHDSVVHHQPHFHHPPHGTHHHHQAPHEQAEHRESLLHDYRPDLPPLTGNHLHESAAERSPIVFNGPQYDSVYDVDTPHVLYAHIADELGHEESANSIASSRTADDASGGHEMGGRDDGEDDGRGLPLDYAATSPAEPIMTETMEALKSSPFLSQYLSTLDSLMPSGFTSRVVQVYKDRKKKKK